LVEIYNVHKNLQFHVNLYAFNLFLLRFLYNFNKKFIKNGLQLNYFQFKLNKFGILENKVTFLIGNNKTINQTNN